MAFKYREEIVGKRFLSVRSALKLKLNKITEWEWRAGVVRAATHKDLQNPELSVLVEFDDRDWSRREWIRIHENIFQIFLVEENLIWGSRTDLTKNKQKLDWPALNFKPLVDKAGIANGKLKPIEYLQDNHLEFIDEGEVRVFKEEEAPVPNLVKDYPEVRKAVKNWIEDQDGQKILLTTPSVLVGYRLRVYRSEGTTQWYTAVIKSYNDVTKELTVVDDTVLEEHNEDPSLVQMKLIGDGVVDSILKGVDVGITPRRRSCNNKDSQSGPHYSRTRSQSPSHSAPTKSAPVRKPRQKPLPAAALSLLPPQAVPPVPAIPPEEKEKPPEKPPARSRTRDRKRKPADTSAKPVVTKVKKTAPPVSNGGSSSSIKRAKSNDKPVGGNTLSELSCAPAAALVQGNVKPAAKPKEKRPKRHKPKSEKNENQDSSKAKLVKIDVKEAPPVEPLRVSETVVTVREETVLPPASVGQNVISEEIKTVIKPAEFKLSEEPVKPVSVSSVSIKPKQQVPEVKEKSPHKKPEKERLKDKPEKERHKSGHKDKPEKERHKDKPEKERHKEKKKRKEKAKRLSVKSDADQSDEDKSCFEHDEETSRLINSIIESISRETREESQEKQKQASRARTKSETSYKSEPIATTSDESGKFSDESAMHYKKQLLLGEKSTQDISAAINLNLSVTDQLAKLAKGKAETNSSNSGASTKATPPPSLESVGNSDRRLSHDSALGESAPSHQSEYRSEHISHVRNDSFSDERSSSRHSSSSRMSDERRPNSRVDEIRRKGIGPSTSPLVFDKEQHKPVEPYRDPELLKKDSEVRHITSLQHAAMQRPHTQTPVSATSTYQSVHTPLAAHHQALSAHHPGSLLTPLHFPQQHLSSMASLSHPHVLTHGAQMDVASLVARGAIPQQQAHLIQYPPHLLQQHQAYSFQLHGNVSLSQLEVLWQRKYPTIPVPPAWMLAQYQDELLRDVNLLRERELLERERIERERLERERERAERERKEREKAQMEREQRERAEKERAERAERDRQEQARKDRERAERDQRERIERQRVLNESAAAAAAVNQHFKESLRLASQKISGMWGQGGGPSISHGLPVKSERSSAEPLRPQQQQPTYSHPGMEQSRDQAERKDQERRERDRESDCEDRKPTKQEYQEGFASKLFVESQQDLLMKQTEEKRKLAIQQEQVLKNMQLHYETQQKLLQEHLKSYDPKVQEAFLKGHPLPPEAMKAVSQSSSGHPYFRSTPQVGSVHQIKQEPNFSLYGYQPFQHSYISQEKLQMHGLGGSDRVKEEKVDSMKHSPSSRSSGTPGSISDKKSGLTSPPPLIKEHMKSGSSVIVENKMKDSKPINYDTKTGGSQLSPRQQHFLLPGQDRARPPSSQVSPYCQSPRTVQADVNMPLDYKRRDVKVSRPQSPLHVASPQQLSAAVMQPMELKHPGANTNAKPPTSMSSLTSNSHAATTSVTSSASYGMPTIAQPPVSLPASTTAYSYSLIQQGLVPNPLYSQTSSMGSTNVSEASSKAMSVQEALRAKHTSSGSHPGTQVPTSTATAGAHSQKRRSHKEGTSRKKTKVSESNATPTSMPIPVTTPRIPTNTSPYTIPTMHTTSASSMPFSTMTTSSNSGCNASINTTSSISLTSRTTGFMDSFKSFVENTVQNAFLEEQKLQSVHPKIKHKTKTTQPSPTPVTTINSVPIQTSYMASSPPMMATSPEIGLGLQLAQPSRPNSTSAGSTSSLMETINRVANGLIDTDSDTLSAPSPPPQKLSSEAAFSPHRAAANHPKLKKAWLQRHSDEDKSNDTNCMKNEPGTPPSDSNSKAQVKDCYVNCSYISPTKEGEGKSPISALAISNGNIKELRMEDDMSTSSASETESQGIDGQSVKRRLKSKRQRPNSANKRLKGEKDGDKAKLVNNNRRTKEERSRESSREKTPKQEQKSDEEKEKEKEKSTEKVPEKPVEKPAKKSKESSSKNNEKLQPSNPESEGSECSNQSSQSKRSRSRRAKEKEGSKEAPKELPKPAKDLKDIKDLAKASPAALSLSKSISIAAANKPLVKLTIAQLKKTMQPFLQNGSCAEVTPKLMKCRECKMTPNQRNKKLPNIFCRFYAFRRLRYSQKGFLTIAGFSAPEDAEEDDIALWMPNYEGAWHGFSALNPPLTLDVAKYIITHVGDKFCELVEQEKEAQEQALSESDNLQVAWKRAVQGVREMCDVCDTTLFNMHWVCHKCGFVVCLDCYRVKMRKPELSPDVEDKPINDEHAWLTCSSNRQPHEPSKLMLTQIIPSTALWELGEIIHNVREKWSIHSNCPCGKSKDPRVSRKNGVSQQLLMDAVTKCMSSESKGDKPIMNGVGDDHSQSKRAKKSRGNGSNHEISLYNDNPETASPLSILADVASLDSDKGPSKRALTKVIEKLIPENSLDGKTTPVFNPNEHKTESSKPQENDPDGKGQPGCSTLRELLTKTGMKVKNSDKKSKSKTTSSTIDDIIQLVVEVSLPKDQPVDVRLRPPTKLTHYIPKNGQTWNGPSMPIKIHTLTETSVLYPDVPHSWLCDGRLLRLHDPRHSGNLEIFQQQWKRGQPVLVSGCDKHLDYSVWRPEAFSRQFGAIENDLVNCHNHVVIVGHPMKIFWDGFEHMQKRLTDDNEEPMLLKLKDWPPTEDFSDILPTRFKNLMEALPLPEYTQRYGILNLASRLPDFFVKPDLGPKMYNAYGSAAFPKEGTTNLHIDISDAVNLMVYVGVPNDDHKGIDHEAAALKAIDEAGCDLITKRRVREIHEKPGALWHIFDARDADKIRDLLNKVAKEQGETIEPDHDPIHDQSWYLDTELRERLHKEYGVLGYPIVQCLGDAVFLPAGAPHQVRNLHSCIKCAEDFVSPEHLRHCFTLTHEFRHLSDTHTNHEDKLQVKNIIYHAVKDSVAILSEHDPKDVEKPCIKDE